MSRTGLGRALAGLVLILTLGVGSAGADSITFNLGGSNDNGFIGNQRIYSSSGLTVYVTAFFHDGYDFDPAAVGRYGGGLGVCNQDEDGSSFPCSDPEHAVDNRDERDFLLFLFDSQVDITSVGVNEYGGGNTDLSYWLGSVAGAATQTNLLTNQDYDDLDDLGFGSRQDNNGDGSRTATLSSPLNNYNALLIGANVFGADGGTLSNCGWDYNWRSGWQYVCDGAKDYFKLHSLTVDFTTPEIPETPVPEPGTIALLGLGLAGLAVARRRQAKRS